MNLSQTNSITKQPIDQKSQTQQSCDLFEEEYEGGSIGYGNSGLFSIQCSIFSGGNQKETKFINNFMKIRQNSFITKSKCYQHNSKFSFGFNSPQLEIEE